MPSTDSFVMTLPPDLPFLPFAVRRRLDLRVSSSSLSFASRRSARHSISSSSSQMIRPLPSEALYNFTYNIEPKHATSKLITLLFFYSGFTKAIGSDPSLQARRRLEDAVREGSMRLGHVMDKRGPVRGRHSGRHDGDVHCKIKERNFYHITRTRLDIEILCILT